MTSPRSRQGISDGNQAYVLRTVTNCSSLLALHCYGKLSEVLSSKNVMRTLCLTVLNVEKK